MKHEMELIEKYLRNEKNNMCRFEKNKKKQIFLRYTQILFGI